ncbi:MAG: phosphodiester glycosidase family protein [Clostridiales bacterium]|nr:phosphodiester glycosidase family protein [Clostridiales bacterium]
MNATNSPFLEKTVNRRKRKKNKRIAVNIVIALFVIALGSAFYIVLNVDDSFATQLLGSPTPRPTYVITLTPMPKVSPDANILVTPSPTATPRITPTPTPVPTPYIHPGIRDEKFTEGDAVIEDMSYHSKELSIEIEELEIGESTVYVADIYIMSMDNFAPVFANDKFHNGYQTTSYMAKENDAIFAINSDSATATDYGIIVRDQEIYRNVLAADHLAVFNDGSMQTFMARKISGQSLIDDDAKHVFCFGPQLFYNGKVIEDFKYSHIRSAHPRTAIGMIEPYHYIIVVVDGRTSKSKGVTLEELSKTMKSFGCAVAYNLDGGGSSTMVFMNELINRPSGGNSERAIDSAILFVESAQEE